MGTRWKITREIYLLLPAFLLFGLIAGCVPGLPAITPPESYKGPIAERPNHQAGDYWLYERDNRTTAKADAGSLAGHIEFPLWLGRTWSYRSGALKIGQPATSKAHRADVEIECEAKAFKQVTVTAGSFDAFECSCQCRVIGAGNYEPGCGQWTIWYAPTVKNIIRTETGSTDSSMQLVEYKALQQRSVPQVATEKMSQRKEQQADEAKPVSRPGFKAEKPEWKVGYEWRYAWKRPGTSGTLVREVVKEDVFNGLPSYMVKAEGNENFYAKDGFGLLATVSKGKVLSKRDLPRHNLSWPLEVGKEWQNAYTLERIEQKSSQRFDQRMVVTKIEEVKVPAGNFQALKIEVSTSRGGNLVEELWYAPQVKWFVKSKFYSQNGVREEELISFKVD